MSDQKKSFILAALAVFFWSTIATAFKLALAEISILQLLFIASATSTLILFIISVIDGKVAIIFKPAPKELAYSALLALLNPLGFYLVVLKAYSLLPAQVAQPLNMIWPIVLVFLSVPLLKQKIPSRSFLALFISLAGVYLITSQGRVFHPGKSDPLGILLAISSSLFWALYFILNLRDSRPDSVKLFTSFFIATIILLISLIVLKDFRRITRMGIATSVYIGIFEMGLTFFLWLRALRLSETTDRISNMVFLAPFISLFFINGILGERIYITTPAGLVLIIGGIIYINTKVKRVTANDDQND